MKIDQALIYKIVKEVLEEKSVRHTDFGKRVDLSGVICIDTETVECEPFDVGVPSKVKLKDLVTLEESPRLGCGILEIDHSAYPWTLNYDEFYYVVDGVLDIVVEGRHNTGGKGDVLYIPKGTSVNFSSPQTCRAVYFTYPADWENAEL